LGTFNPNVRSYPPHPQHVAICTVGELFGGVERHVLGLLKGLAAHGVRTVLLLFHDGELAAQARDLDVEPTILSHRNFSFITTARRVGRTLKERNASVVHAHGYKATVFCAAARCWHPIPMIKTEHGLPEPMSGSLLRAWRNQFYHWSDTIAVRTAGAALCYVTDDLRNAYRQHHFGLPTRVIPNGIEPMDRRQFRRPPELREEWFNLLIVGRLDTVKGHHLAVEAMAKVVTPDVHLHLVGVGPREHELRMLAESLGVAHRIHVLGFRRNVFDYIAHCNVVLMPSLHEGLPYTLLEALALGTPIIASRVGGLAEVLRDGETALLIPPQDATSLTLAIERLYNDRPLCLKLGRAGRSLQQSEYSLEAMTKEYLAVYRSLMVAGESDKSRNENPNSTSQE
jgi:glycosyltransferase involved in cell wall biosynthesis